MTVLLVHVDTIRCIADTVPQMDIRESIIALFGAYHPAIAQYLDNHIMQRDSAALSHNQSP